MGDYALRGGSAIVPSTMTIDHAHRLTREQLYDLVWSRSLSALANDFGVSGNGLAKICDRLNIPHPPRGYWSGDSARRGQRRPPLLDAPDDCESEVSISSTRAASRRSRTRLSLEDRRAQIVDAAARIIDAHGLAAASIKRIAREVGISEAQVYNYFTNQLDLFTYMARREQAQMTAMQDEAINRHEDYLDRVRASMVGYLDYIALKGSLLQTLLAHPEVRAALKVEHQNRRARATEITSANFTTALNVDSGTAVAATQILRAIGVRSGKLLASRKIDRALAGRLARHSMDGARSRLVASVRSAPPPESPRPRRSSSRAIHASRSDA